MPLLQRRPWHIGRSQGSGAPRAGPLRILEHDPEKCEAVFRKDHAQTIT
jgi:hypothetical protein